MVEPGLPEIPFAAFFTESPVPMAVLSGEGGTLAVNGAFEQLLGYTASEISGRNLLELVTEGAGEHRRRYDSLKHFIGTDLWYRSEEVGILRKDGDVAWVLLNMAPFLSKDSKRAYVVATLTEISAYKRLEDHLEHALNLAQSADSKYWQIFEAIPQPMIFLTDEGRIENANTHARTLLGYARDELIGRPIEFLYPDVDWELQFLDPPAFRSGPGSFTAGGAIETAGIRKDGGRLPSAINLGRVQLGDARLWIAVIENLSQHKVTQERLIYLSKYDSLTGLYNRMIFQDRVFHAIRISSRTARQAAVLFIDLDRFKHVNESFGHEAGDELLRLVAARIRACVRECDTVARFVGDKFTVLLEGVSNALHVTLVARKLLGSFAAPLECQGHEVYLTASIGISMCPADGVRAEILIKHAERATYQAKERGRDTFHFYTPGHQAVALERLNLDAELHRALMNNEFVLHYQPQLAAEDDSVVGVEALLRWQHPYRGIVPPLDFVPVLEETGLIVAVGQWVLRTACEAIRSLHEIGHSALRVAVNISARQFMDRTFVEMIRQTVTASKVEPNTLELEITESVLIKDYDGSTECLRDLAKLGVRIAIDDFGTGYSSLSHLKQFPLHSLKIDRSFVDGIPRNRNDIAIATGIIGIAENLDLNVTAEGVETEEQLAFLKARHCHQMQGYLFARPMPGPQLRQWLEARA